MSTPAFELGGSHLKRRRRVNRGMEVLAWLAAAIAVGILAVVVWSVAKRGASELNLDLITKPPIPFSLTNAPQGLSNAFLGTLVLVGLATAMALPVGILVAVYLNEFAPPSIRNGVTLVLDILNGVPAIVIGIFVFGLLVLGHTQSALAAGVALAIIMLPLVARSTQEVLALVPGSLREASFALGVSRWRTVLGVILPTSFGGILTGATLAIARAAGETAPLLFTSALTTSQTSWDPRRALQSIPLTIFEDLEQPDPKLHAQAWGAAFVLMAFVLVVSVLSKLALARSRRKLTR